MKSVQITALVVFCALIHQGIAGIAEEKWKKDGGKICANLEESIRKALDELPNSSSLSQLKKSEISTFMTVRIFNLVNKILNKFEHKFDNLATLRKQLLRDGAKLLVLRARWPLHQVEAAVDKLIESYEKKVEHMGITELHHEARMSALDLEHIIQEVLMTLLQDPEAVSLLQFLGSIPASLHRIADELFTNKTFPEIFEMLGINQEEPGNAETLLAPFAKAITKPKIDNSQTLEIISFIVHSAMKSIEQDIEEVRSAVLDCENEIKVLDLELRREMQIHNEELWGKIKKFAENVSTF